MKQNPQTIRVTVRQDKKTGEVMLFFVNENDMGFWLEGYAHIGQHFQPSWDYMLSCRLMRPGKLSDEAKALVQEWDNLGPDDDRYTAKVCARLTYPKRKNYIGN